VTDNDLPALTVHKLAHYVQVNLLGLDDQGRQQYVCRSQGCGETAYFDAEGLGHCPTDEAMQAFLTQSIARMGEVAVEWRP